MIFESPKNNGIYTALSERNIFTLINTAHGKFSVYAEAREFCGINDKSLPLADNVSREEAEQICAEYNQKPLFRLCEINLNRIALMTENPYNQNEWCVLHTEPNTNAGMKLMRKFLKMNFASRFSKLKNEEV